MIGRKLAARLATDGRLADAPVAQLTLVDAYQSECPAVEAPQVEGIVADLSEPDTAADLVSRRPDVIFHLAAIVSGEAESDFERGYRVNVDGTRLLLDAVRASVAATVRGSVFASSIAVSDLRSPR